MARKELVIGVLGTLVLVAVMFGIFRFEATQGGGSSFRVVWETSDVAGPGASGTTTEGDATPASVEITQRNATRIEFALAWTDDLGAPDAFNITVTSPTGETRSAQGDSGRVVVLFDRLAVVPPEQRLLGADESVVRERVDADFASEAGLGRWNVTVTLVEAGEQEAPVGNVVIQQDNANEWALATSVTRYEASVTRG